MLIPQLALRIRTPHILLQIVDLLLLLLNLLLLFLDLPLRYMGTALPVLAIPCAEWTDDVADLLLGFLHALDEVVDIVDVL